MIHNYQSIILMRDSSCLSISTLKGSHSALASSSKRADVLRDVAEAVLDFLRIVDVISPNGIPDKMKQNTCSQWSFFCMCDVT